jgi:SAM-dependent methyltransferase
MYDYYLGGKDHFAIDRETAERGMQSWPTVRTATRENRKFLTRAVNYLAAEAGIRQFLDIGTGLPTAGNTHEVAQAIAADSRIMYVDNDPLVLAHARALLTSAPEGTTGYIEADLREPGKILANPMVSEVLDLTRPVAVMLVAILHFIADADDPGGIVASLLAALAPGSYLVATSVSPEDDPEGVHGLERTYREGGMTLQARTADEFGRLVFSGLELVPPGMVLVSEWRPDDEGPRPRAADVSVYGAVARKPAASS